MTSSPPVPTTGAGNAPPCQVKALALRYGPVLSPMTGEHGVFYALVNRGLAACMLTGYPDVTLYDATGEPLPFHYAHRHSPYVTSAAPATVTLAPGKSAYVLVAKYRCDSGISQDAITIRLTLPDPQRAVLTGRASPDRAGVSALSYCRGGPDDPGQTVGVSPIEPTLVAAGPFAQDPVVVWPRDRVDRTGRRDISPRTSPCPTLTMTWTGWTAAA